MEANERLALRFAEEYLMALPATPLYTPLMTDKERREGLEMFKELTWFNLPLALEHMPKHADDPDGERFEEFFQLLQLAIFSSGSPYEEIPEDDDDAFGAALFEGMMEREQDLAVLRKQAHALSISWQVAVRLGGDA